MTEIVNAVIRNISLGYEDHGIFTAYLHLDHEKGIQSFGGYFLDTYDEELKMRLGKAWGLQFIIQVMKVIGVDKWEDLQGKHIRADLEHTKIHGIGHIIEDRWFYPENDPTLKIVLEQENLKEEV